MQSKSYSVYSTELQCLRKYKYCYIDKLLPEGPESSDLIFGSALHSAINSALTGIDPFGTFELYWESYKDKDLQYGRHSWKDLMQMGLGFIRKFMKSYAADLKLKFAETRLYGEYKGIKFDGKPDFYGDYYSSSLLLDFKTASLNYSLHKKDTAIQLNLYAYLLLENKIGAIDNLGYLVFNKGTGSIQTPLIWKFDEEKMYAILDDLVSYVKLLEQGEYPRNLNACLDYNRKCPYWDLCHKEDKND